MQQFPKNLFLRNYKFLQVPCRSVRAKQLFMYQIIFEELVLYKLQISVHFQCKPVKANYLFSCPIIFEKLIHHKLQIFARFCTIQSHQSSFFCTFLKCQQVLLSYQRLRETNIIGNAHIPSNGDNIFTKKN